MYDVGDDAVSFGDSHESVAKFWRQLSIIVTRVAIVQNFQNFSMKWTTKGHYSVKALLDLAMSGSRQPASVRAIAERQHIPAPYLEKLLIDLRQAGLLRSRRGAHGGYQLARAPRDISLAEILEAVGDRIQAQPPNSQATSDAGELAEDWVVQAVWQRIATRLQQALQDITLEDLYFDARSWQAAHAEATEFFVV